MSSETATGTTRTTTYDLLMFLLYITARIYMVEVYLAAAHSGPLPPCRVDSGRRWLIHIGFSVPETAPATPCVTSPPILWELLFTVVFSLCALCALCALPCCLAVSLSRVVRCARCVALGVMSML